MTREPKEQTRTTIYINSELKETVHELARREERSLSNLISILLKEALRGREERTIGPK